jgi:hypothetical protein
MLVLSASVFIAFTCGGALHNDHRDRGGGGPGPPCLASAIRSEQGKGSAAYCVIKSECVRSEKASALEFGPDQSRQRGCRSDKQEEVQEDGGVVEEGGGGRRRGGGGGGGAEGEGEERRWREGVE